MTKLRKGAWSKTTGARSVLLSPKKEAAHLKVRIEAETQVTVTTVQRFCLTAALQVHHFL